MSVAYDNSVSTETNAVTTDTLNLTIGSITNGVVVVGLAFYVGGGGVSGISVTVGGVSATLLSGSDSGTSNVGQRTLIYYLATGSTTGSVAVVVSWTFATQLAWGATSFSGADQTTSCQNGNASQNYSSSPSLTVSSATNDISYAVMGAVGNNVISSPSNTSAWNAYGITTSGAAQYASGASSTTYTWSIGGINRNWAMSGCDIIVASGGGGPTAGFILESGTGYIMLEVGTNVLCME